MKSVTTKSTKGTAIDLFAGAGGVTTGFKAAHANVLAAVEIDPYATRTFAANHPEVRIWQADIAEVKPEALLQELGLVPGELTLLGACAPCQGYSSIGARRPDDPRNDLVLRVLDFVAIMRPRAVAFENVPHLVRDQRFCELVHGLRRIGYGVQTNIVDAAEFGVPQRRRRLVVLAALGVSDVDVPSLKPTKLSDSGAATPVWVRHAFSQLQPIDSGDPLHVSRDHHPRVLERIRAIPKDGGSRSDLPTELQLRCHTHLGKNSTSVYGRMRWDDVAPTLTTRCTSPSCGRFLHPEEDRAITLREAAALQTFPDGYHFVGGRKAIESQIGNAIPVRLAQAIWTTLEPIAIDI